MALVRKGGALVRPPLAERLERAMKLEALSGGDSRACSLLLGYLAHASERHPLLRDGRIGDRLEALTEAVGAANPDDAEAYADLLDRVRQAEGNAAKPAARLASELGKAIASCKRWLADNAVAELDMQPRLERLFPVYALVLLLGIARRGVLTATADGCRLHPDHRWLLQSIRFGPELSLESIVLLREES